MPYKDPEQAKRYRQEWQARNKEHMREYGKEYRVKHAERLKDFELKRKYGLTRVEHDSMRERQQYKCAWCGRHEDELGQGAEGLCVDHCHESGAVRRLFCPNCNRSEGMLKHSPEIIAAIEAVAWFPMPMI